MARAKIKMYPYACVQLGDKGMASVGYGAHSWPHDPMYSKDYNHVLIPLSPVEVEVEVPDDLRPQCLEILGKFRQDIKAEHQLTLTRLHFAENSLLGLAAPEVLDAREEATPRKVGPAPGLGRPWDDADDDIPF